MERREAIKYTALFMGAAVSSATIASMLSGCTVDESDAWQPSFFTMEESDFIIELGETMLPKTNTPGAKDAMVNRYLDTIRPLRYTEEDNVKFKEELNAFIKQSTTELGASFLKTSPEKRLVWLQSKDQSSYTLVADNPDLPKEERPFYLSLKEQVLAGYFTSEKVAKAYFAFDPVPGRYDPCIPFTEVGKAWAL